MKRILTTFKREKGDASEKRYRDTGDRGRSGSSTSLPEDDSPEGRIVIATKSFCESGGPQSQNPGDEVLHLPAIVDLAESSPVAARAAAHTIRKYLEQKKNNSLRPHTQYNAIMLMRILSDNPGRTFTRNLGEAKFVAAVKELLKHGREPSVRQILVETLEHFDEKVRVGEEAEVEVEVEVEGLKGLVEVWAKERRSMTKLSRSAPASSGGGGGLFASGSNNTDGQHQPPHYPAPQSHLPNMEELAARISEAQTSAKLLEQVLQSTPHPEIPQSELIREFADRCRVASRSIQGYISAAAGGGDDGGGGGGDSGTDEDTLTTLIMTNDLLTTAVGKHACAVKEALEKQEVHKTVEGARITDVAGEDTGVVGGRGDEPVTPPRGAGMEVGVRRDAQRERERVPDSPVSPTTPGPVAYRY